jgi:hypothetical protein
VARTGERRGVLRDLVRKPGGKRPFGRRRRTHEDNIKIVLQEVRWGLEYGQAFMNPVMNFRIP